MITKSMLIRRLPLAILLCLAQVISTTAVPAESRRPGMLDLAGAWSALGDQQSDATLPEPDDSWDEVSLPATVAAVGLTNSAETLWLKRRVELGEDWDSSLAPSGLGVLIGNSIHGDYEVFADGQSVGFWHHPPPGMSEPGPRIYEIPSRALDSRGRLELTLRWRWPGWSRGRALRQERRIGEGWLLGDLERLRAEAELVELNELNAELPLIILVMLYAAIGLYHLQLFRRDRRCTEYLWFGVTALIVACHTLLLTHWLSSLGGHHGLIRRAYDITGSLMIASSIQFLWPFLSRGIGRALRAYQLSFLGLAGLIAVLPERFWLPSVETFCKAWNIPFLAAVAVLLVQEIRRGNAEARTIALGGFALVAAGTSDTMAQLVGWGTTFPLQVFAFTVFALAMAFSLSNRFSRVHRDLDTLRLQLEDMVEDRADELSGANERLKSEIAERELAQEAMRMLERAVEQSIDGILVSDLEGDTLFINEAWARLHEQEAFATFGRGLDLFHTPEQIERHVRPALQRVKEEGAWEGEISHCRKDGSIFPTWMSVTLLRDPEREPVGFVMVARDLTERRRASEERQRIEARIQQAEKLRSLGNLAGGIAHDYNNLLTAVLGNSSLAIEELPSDSPAGEKLIQITSAAERAADLTSQLLAYAGDEAIVTKQLDLSILVDNARRDLARTAGTTDLEVELANGLPEVDADPAQVRQVISNLIANAADAVAQVGGGEIRLETGMVAADPAYFSDSYPDEDRPPGDYVFLRIADTGKGIDPEGQSRIFDPFFSTKKSSRGLGLATALSIVRAHGGAIKVSSRPLEGATFELLFPAASDPVEGVAATADKTRAKWRGSGTVLVIDDEHIMREVSRSILEQSGFDVLTTGEGQQALEIYRQHMEEIRLVLLDRTMPTMSGLEVLTEIRALNPRAKVVLMSGYKPDAAVRELTSGDLTDFLPKPFRPGELLDVVRDSVGQS
ncbi:MAG: response regulator [bacterium]|nr:response regulator [bacterium]